MIRGWRARVAAPKSVDVTHLEQRVRSLRNEVDRLVLALATSDEKPQAIVSAISERQAQLNELTATIAATQAAPKAIGAELSRLEADARGRLSVLRDALAASPTKAREVMKALFEGPLKVHHEEGLGAVITGTAVLGPLFVAASPNVASPTGFEGEVSRRRLGNRRRSAIGCAGVPIGAVAKSAITRRPARLGCDATRGSPASPAAGLITGLVAA